MGECGPEEYFLICRKCPICCLESLQNQVSTPPPMPPKQPPRCCKAVPVPIPVPVPVIRPQKSIMTTENPSTQCCLAPRPSPQCCQAPAAPSPSEVIVCCQLRPEPANPCCQAAAAASQKVQNSQNNCVCTAPRPIPCRCSAPTPTSLSVPSSPSVSKAELECVLGACPVYIARCPMSSAAPQPAGCQRRRFRRDAYQSLLQQLSHNIPFQM
uniref:IGFBP N-terminal domain-containing protein n=1 Tax=Syphacia muris TaxID=451379 RepID=A0A0N5AT35_9BILA